MMKLPMWGRDKEVPARLTAFDPPVSEREKLVCAARSKLLHELDDDLRDIAAGIGWRQDGLGDIISAQMIRCSRQCAI